MQSQKIANGLELTSWPALPGLEPRNARQCDLGDDPL